MLSCPALITIDEIYGDLVHSGSCQDQLVMSRNPTIPLHPDIRALMLELVRGKIALTVAKEKARKYAISRWGEAPGDGYHQFRLRDHDSSSLYRTLGSEIGITAHSTAQGNLDLWFRADNPCPPTPILTASCLSYTPEIVETSQRFMIVLSTPLQQKMAWKYGHKSQLLMDLTFGVCSARVLLIILMVIDDANKGIPVAQILFTARQEARAVHADYNKLVLEKAL